MKIEAGKYYRNREGTVVGPIEVNNDKDFPFTAYSGPVFLTYTDEGTWFGVDEDETQEDLVEECNADGSPIVVQSNPLTADRSWRDEIALRVLPGLLSLGSDLEDADLPNGTQGEIAVKQAFYIADVFLKAAKQS